LPEALRPSQHHLITTTIIGQHSRGHTHLKAIVYFGYGKGGKELYVASRARSLKI
jgi:hypothetical protein